jgi:hypothetical protein
VEAAAEAFDVVLVEIAFASSSVKTLETRLGVPGKRQVPRLRRWQFFRIRNPALADWANLCRAYGAGNSFGFVTQP